MKKKSMKINKQKIKNYMELPLFAGLVFVVLFLLTGDAYKSIFAASFIFVFVSMKDEKVFLGAKDDKDSESFFKNSILGSALHALFVLFGTVILTTVLYMVFVDYCSKSNLFYSKERCAIEKATQSISEQYGSAYDDYSDVY